VETCVNCTHTITNFASGSWQLKSRKSTEIATARQIEDVTVGGKGTTANRIHIRTKGQIDRDLQKAPQETAILQNDGTRVEWRRMETPLSIDYKKSYTDNLCEESTEANGWENLKTDE